MHQWIPLPYTEDQHYIVINYTSIQKVRMKERKKDSNLLTWSEYNFHNNYVITQFRGRLNYIKVVLQYIYS